MINAEKQLMCQHKNFYANCDVNRIIDTGKFSVDIKIHCEDCGLPFSFMGLPCGLDCDGAAVSPDGTEGRFAIRPGRSGILENYLPDEEECKRRLSLPFRGES